jgi:hypothetical protein
MTAPLRKEKDEDFPITDVNSSSEPNEVLESEAQQERLKLVESKYASRGDAERPATERLAPAPPTGDPGVSPKGTAEEATALFPGNELRELQGRWDQIQTAFVDQPRNAVHDADSLVSSAMQRLADAFADERAKLERQWDKGDSVSTEDLRVALQRYRSFFRRVLSV